MDPLNPTATPPTGTPARAARWPVVLALAVVAASAVGAWLLLTHEGTPAQPPADSAPATDEAGAGARPGSLPSAATTDALLRQRLAGLSTAPEWAAWLKEADLLRRFAAVVAAFAEGESPRALVPFLAPQGSFQVREVDDGLLIDPASYARYDAIGRVVGALDAQALAAVFREVRPVVEALYREGARPGSTLDAALSRAFSRVLAVPVLEGDVEVEADGAMYTFVDPALEALSPAEKHLVRMGPATVRTLQEKVREVAAALGVELQRR